MEHFSFIPSYFRPVSYTHLTINIMDIEYVRSRFIKHFDGTTGSVYASPGRINLIGEHTDYNGGFVLSLIHI